LRGRRIARASVLAVLAALAALEVLATVAVARAGGVVNAASPGDAAPVPVGCSDVHDVRVADSGVSSESYAGTTIRIDILSLVLGPAERSEQRAYPFTAAYGPHGLDAYIWTPARGESGRWLRVEYTRPATFVEVERFERDPAHFRATAVGDPSLLPGLLHHLDPPELPSIGHIVCFKAGGLRLELVRGAATAWP
jgi:hypothetical protein